MIIIQSFSYSIALLIGIYVFPDSDQKILSFLSHRSILTHGILLPVLIYLILNKILKYKKETLDYIYAGLLIGISIHLTADLFSKSFVGYATIKLPFQITSDGFIFKTKSIGSFQSIFWIFFNAILGLFISYKTLDKQKINNFFKIILFIIPLIVGIFYMISEDGTFLKLITFIIFFVFILTYNYRKNS